MIVSYLNQYEQTQKIPGYVRFGSVYLHESFQNHIYTKDTITLLWSGTLMNRDLLNTTTQTDEETIVALYQRVGIEEMLRRINADFTLFMLFDANLYGSEKLLFIASPPLPSSFSPTSYYLSHDVVSTVSATENHLLSVATYRVWRKSFLVHSQWVLDPQSHVYFLPPVPIHVPDETNMDTIIHYLAKEAIMKKWRAYQSPPVVLLYAPEEAENPPLFAFLQGVLSSVCECRVLQELPSEIQETLFLISYPPESQHLGCIVFPFQERDLFQFLSLST